MLIQYLPAPEVAVLCHVVSEPRKTTTAESVPTEAVYVCHDGKEDVCS